MTICAKCDLPLVSGQFFRGQFTGRFQEMSTGITHAVQIIEEEWLEHETCPTDPEGD